AGSVISGGTLEVQNGGSLGSPAVKFGGSGGVLKIDGTAMPSNTISGFVLGDTLDLAGASFANGGRGPLRTGNRLTLVAGSSSYTLHLDPTETYSGKSFRLSSDGSGGTDIQVVSGLTINVSYDSSVSGAPAGLRSGVAYAINDLETHFTNGATVNITVGFG